MKNNYSRLLKAILLCGVISMFTPVFSQTIRKEYVDGSIYFKLKDNFFFTVRDNRGSVNMDDLPFLRDIREQFKIREVLKPFFSAKSELLKKTFRIEFSDHANADKIISALMKTGIVEYAEQVPYPTISYAPNDPSYSGSQWYLAKIKAPGAWDYSKGDSKITLAVVDVAISINHPDLKANIWVNPGEIAGNNIDDDNNGYIDDINGWDTADNDNNPSPPNTSFNHGTHCAGDAGAVSDNNAGISSIGFGISIIAIKAQYDTGSSGGLSKAYEGVTYAADAGADVISLSWGGTTFTQTGQNVIDYAASKGCVIIGGAGNSNVETKFYPAALNNVISVAASDEQDKKASFSSYGTWVDITAPGNNIYSTIPNSDYALMSGTSMATPIVAGLCALMLSVNPNLTPADIESCLKSSADDIYPLNTAYAGKLGAGRINATEAMKCASASLTLPPTANYTADRTSICSPVNIQFTDQSTFSPTSWLWDFGDGTTSTLANPVHLYTANGNYNVTLTATNANGSDSEVKSSYISVSMPAGPAVTGDLICGPGTVNLSASGSYTLKWYAAASGGTAINTGTTYAPTISTTTTYYVADEQIKPVQKVGEPNNSKTGGYLSTPDRKLIFDVLGEVVIKSVVLYANSPGNRIIEVWSNAAVIVASKTVSVPAAGMNRVTLDFTLPAGKDYSIKLATNTPVSNLYRNNAGGLSYPYTISNLVSIKTSDASGAGIVPTNYYYYFYDWEVQGAPCVSARVPVTGTVQTCSGVATAQETDNLTLFPNPVHDKLSVQGKRSGAAVKIEITNVLGKIIAEQTISANGDFSASFDLSSLGAGMYWVSIEADGKKNVQRFVKE